MKTDLNRTCTLETLPRGKFAVIDSICSKNSRLCSKLVSMGLVQGTELEVLAIAPFGGPIQIRTKGYKLSLRANEAEKVNCKVLAR